MEEVENTRAAINKRKSKPTTKWSPYQIFRLQYEKRLLEKLFPDRVTWIDPTGDTKVEVSLNTNYGNKYCLRIYLEPDFPNSVPDMVVRSSPNPMPSWGIDGNKHTLGNRDGFLKICHCCPNYLTSSSTLYDVVMKGLLWLEAYEGYLMTGNDLSTFLVVMKLRE